jgi:nucleoside-diphosphate-sugar epimerase
MTGAIGFVGKNLQDSLKQSNSIKPMIIRYSANQVFELNDEIVIHLASKAPDLKKAVNPKDYYEANFELTKQLYDTFLKLDAKKFIFISSVKAPMDFVNDVLTEEFIPNPQTHFGKSKLMAEEYIRSQILPAGKSYYILRSCMIHGPGNMGNLNLVYQFVKKGIPYPLAAFENQRSFLSLENLCFVIKKLLERDIPSGTYNLADDEALSTNELVKEIAITLDLKPKLWAIPVQIIKSLAKLGYVFRHPLNSERLGKLTENYAVSNQKN